MANDKNKTPTAQELYDKAWWLHDKNEKDQLYSICKTIFELYPNTKQARWVVDNFKITSSDVTSWVPKQLPVEENNIAQPIKTSNIAVITSDLKSDDWMVREKAVDALCEMRDYSSIEPLIFAISDRDSDIQAKAITRLKEITGQDFGNNSDNWRAYCVSNVNALTERIKTVARVKPPEVPVEKKKTPLAPEYAKKGLRVSTLIGVVGGSIYAMSGINPNKGHFLSLQTNLILLACPLIGAAVGYIIGKLKEK